MNFDIQPFLFRSKKTESIYLPCSQYAYFYLDAGKIKYSDLRDYVLYNIPKVYPGSLDEIEFQIIKKGVRILVLLIKKEILISVRKKYPKKRMKCIIHGFEEPKNDCTRVMIFNNHIEAATWTQGYWSRVIIINSQLLQEMLKSDMVLKCYLVKGGNIDLLGLDLDGISIIDQIAKNSSLFDIQSNIFNKNIIVINFILGILLLNFGLYNIGLKHQRTISLHREQLEMITEINMKMHNLDKKIRETKDNLKYVSERPSPSDLFIELGSSSMGIEIMTISYNKGAFSLRGRAKNALGYVQSLDGNDKFKDMKLTNVKTLAKEMEEFSLSGKFNDN